MRERDDSSATAVIGRLAGRVIFTALMVLLIFVSAKYAYDFGRDIFYQRPMEEEPGRDIEFEIAETDSVAEVLLREGLIRNEKAFSIMENVYKLDAVPGTYILNTSMTSKEILQGLSEQSAAIEEEAESAEQKEDGNVVGGGDEEG